MPWHTSCGVVISFYIHLFAKDYLVFYLLGITFRYKNWYEWFAQHQNIVGILGLTGTVLFSIIYTTGIDCNTILTYLIRTPLTIFVFMIISQWKSDSKINRFVNYCGHISLDIYVIHYFFFLGFKGSISTILQGWQMSEFPFVIQLLVFSIGMFMILIPSIFVSKIIHANRLLEKILLGRF